MPFDVINTGTTANDGTGDPLRTAFTKTNTNFALAVEGATGSTSNNVPVFDGTTGKLVKDSGVSIATLTGGLNFAGLWNASTNTPTLTSSVGTEGTYYLVSVAGSTNLNGVSSWAVGDSALFTGGVWVNLVNNFVSNAGASTNNAVAVFDGTTGKLVKNGGTGVTASVGKFAPTGNIAAGNGMYLPTTNTVAFSTNGSERLRIDSAGNVGIGATTPRAILQVEGAVYHSTSRETFNTGVNQYEDFEFARFNVNVVGVSSQRTFSGIAVFHVTAFRGASTNHQSTRAVQYFVTLGSFPDSSATSRGRAQVSLIGSNRTSVGGTPGTLDVTVVVEGSTDGGTTWISVDETTGINITGSALMRLRANLTGSTPSSFAGRFITMASVNGSVFGIVPFENVPISII
jgi:hypothetical protein